jgi:hypothetical protein
VERVEFAGLPPRQGAALHSKYSFYDFILIINQRVGWSPAGRSRATTHENFLVTDRKDFV